jgi:hypothetical protein
VGTVLGLGIGSKLLGIRALSGTISIGLMILIGTITSESAASICSSFTTGVSYPAARVVVNPHIDTTANKMSTLVFHLPVDIRINPFRYFLLQ